MHRRSLVRALLAASLFTSLAAAPGCLRRRFDLCSETPPHPECPSRDAGRDADRDADQDAPATPDAPMGDAGTDAR